jgi:hypothetical protein
MTNSQTKLTAEQVQEWERDALIDALCDGSIELTDEFLDKHAGNKLRAVLVAIPERDRAFHLDGHIDNKSAFFNGTVPSEAANAFLLPCSEIETQFDGDAALAFESLDDFMIQGDLAYLYVGYGLTVPVNVDALEQEYREWTRDA